MNKRESSIIVYLVVMMLVLNVYVKYEIQICWEVMLHNKSLQCWPAGKASEGISEECDDLVNANKRFVVCKWQCYSSVDSNKIVEKVMRW
mgnify:CR=1 FL=1